MLRLDLSEAAAVLDAELIGEDVVVEGVSTDTRTVRPQNLFVALVGERFDGHAFVAEAAERGAAAAAVMREVQAPLPMLRVGDTRGALGELARAWRQRFDIPLVGVTGSNGKTTVKEMTAAILALQGPVHATRGNLNNDIGVPLTLFELGAEHQAAVIEMGANHAGEIARLTDIARPTVAVITNAGPAHLEGFGSIEGVAHAKGEIFSGLGPQGTAVINADDAWAGLWRALAAGRTRIHFGTGPDADVQVRRQAEGEGSRLHLRTPWGAFETLLPLPGAHNALNAAAATACALAAGATPEMAAEALARVQGVQGRLQPRSGVRGCRLVDDSYNANPASLDAALDWLATRPGRHWLLLGDMGELGEEGLALHAAMGRRARESGVERLYGLGEQAAAAVEAFGPGAVWQADRDVLVERLREELAEDVWLLVKGSRFMRLEEIVAALAGGER